MRAVLQRVREASVTVDDEVVGSVEHGLLVLLGVAPSDGPAEVSWMARKVAGLRIFADDEGRMNRSVVECGGGALVVSQFTLYGNTAKGRRPSWIDAARPEHAEPLVERVIEGLRSLGAMVATGRFRTEMRVEIVNDGPVTLLLEV